MEKFIIILLIASIIIAISTIKVNAEEVEVIEEVEVVEEVEMSINELLSELINKVEITNFILLFAIIVHYVEKWLKLFVSGFDPHLN